MSASIAAGKKARAAAFGRQDGKFEAWVWPIKVLHGFRLEFRQDGMPVGTLCVGLVMASQVMAATDPRPHRELMRDREMRS